MDVQIKAGMNRFQWNMRGLPPPAGAAEAARREVMRPGGQARQLRVRREPRAAMPEQVAAADAGDAAAAQFLLWPPGAAAAAVALEASVEAAARCSIRAPTWSN